VKKIIFDTSSLIRLCNKEEFNKIFINLIKKFKIVLSTTVIDEFNKKASEFEQKNLQKIKKESKIVSDNYLTIGESSIGVSSIPPSSYGVFYKTPIDTKKAYKESGTKLSIKEWITKKQNDGRIFSHAIENNCDIIITDDSNFQRDFDYKVSIIKIEKFIENYNLR
jgi:predicted nucleic acid-binding protein